MATAYTTTGSWQGRVKTAFQTADKVAGLEAPAEGYIWRRKKYTVDRYRYGKGLTGFLTTAGTRVYGDDLTITNGSYSNAILSGESLDLMVIDNSIEPDPTGTDMWKESHVCEGYSEWEQWEILEA